MWQTFTQWMSDWTFLSILIRLLLAWVIGFAIGVNRERNNRSAGIRTHVLVCVGAALVMMTGQFIFLRFPGANGDVARLGAQVISGIGFLGAGTIIVTQRRHIRGLTTAAGLWACACTGLAIGIGFIEGTIIAAILIVVTLSLMSVAEKKMRRDKRHFDLYVEFKPGQNTRVLMRFFIQHHVTFSEFHLMPGTAPEEGAALTVNISLNRDASREQFLKELEQISEIDFFEII